MILKVKDWLILHRNIPGYIYAPYIPLYLTEVVIEPNEFVPKNINSRYSIKR